MDLGLKGKAAMVAGASRGLGFAVARALAAEGARVSISSRDAGAIEKAAAAIRSETGAEVLARAVDVRQAADLEAWRDETRQALRRPADALHQLRRSARREVRRHGRRRVAERVRAARPLGDPHGPRSPSRRCAPPAAGRSSSRRRRR